MLGDNGPPEPTGLTKHLLTALGFLASIIGTFWWRERRRLDQLTAERDQRLKSLESENEKLRTENATLKAHGDDEHE